MSPFNRKTDEEKQAEREHKERQASADQVARQAHVERIAQHEASLPKWEYQVKRVGEDKQKGLMGSQRMEQIFNGEGAKGWELVAINEERATFKRRSAG